MMRLPRSCGSIGRWVLGLAVLWLLPSGLFAETVNVANDTKVAMVVQVAYVVKGKVIRDKPIPLKAGATVPLTTLPGIKLITIYDAARPDRVLHQSTLPASLTDQSYVVTPNPIGKGVILDPIKPMGGGDGVSPKDKDKDPPPKSGGLPPK